MSPRVLTAALWAYALSLIFLGLGSYLGTGSVSKTALIPSLIGLIFAVIGAVIQLAPGARKHAMHAAAALSLLATAATARAIPKAIQVLGGAEIERPAAVLAQSITALLSAAFLALCIASFVAARRARAAQPAE